MLALIVNWRIKLFHAVGVTFSSFSLFVSKPYSVPLRSKCLYISTTLGLNILIFCVGSLSNMKMLPMHTRPALFHFSTAERFLTRAVTDPKNVSRCPRALTIWSLLLRLVAAWGQLPANCCIGWPHCLTQSCLSMLIFGLDTHVPIEIMWMSGAMASSYPSLFLHATSFDPLTQHQD